MVDQHFHLMAINWNKFAVIKLKLVCEKNFFENKESINY